MLVPIGYQYHCLDQTAHLESSPSQKVHLSEKYEHVLAYLSLHLFLCSASLTECFSHWTSALCSFQTSAMWYCVYSFVLFAVYVCIQCSEPVSHLVSVHLLPADSIRYLEALGVFPFKSELCTKSSVVLVSLVFLSFFSLFTVYSLKKNQYSLLFFYSVLVLFDQHVVLCIYSASLFWLSSLRIAKNICRANQL